MNSSIKYGFLSRKVQVLMPCASASTQSTQCKNTRTHSIESVARQQSNIYANLWKRGAEVLNGKCERQKKFKRHWEWVRRELAENSNEMGGHIACLQSFTSLIVNVRRARACTPETFCSDHFIHLHCCDKDRRLVGKNARCIWGSNWDNVTVCRHSKRQHTISRSM